MVIAQDRPTSQDFSMPETSIKTGDVDFILPLDHIAAKLIALVGAGTGKRPDPSAAHVPATRPARARRTTAPRAAKTKPAKRAAPRRAKS
jgi:hypothetical protein